MPHPIDQLPTIALTMGDPAGVGPEIVLKALADPQVAPLANWTVVGDSRILEMAERSTGLKLASALLRDTLTLGDVADFSFGRLDARCGVAAVEYVRIATGMCVMREADAMVTAPLNKEAVTLSGRPFTGHTEYIAELCGVAESRMLLASDRLATVHVSTHVPLRHACDLNTHRILQTIEMGDKAMRLLGFDPPRIAVCGLNPHAEVHRSRHPRGARQGNRMQRSACRRHRLPASVARRLRPGGGPVPRSGPHSHEAAGFRRHGEHIAGNPHHSDLGGPRHGLRHRRQEPGRPAQHEAGHAHGRAHGGRAAGRTPLSSVSIHRNFYHRPELLE
jgi:hypothetical protein